MLKIINKDDISIFLLCFLSFFVIMPFGMLSIALITFSLWTFFIYRKTFVQSFKDFGIKPYLECVLFYLLLILSIVYSSNKSEGLKEIQKGLPLLILPLIFLYGIRDLILKKIKFVLYSFVISNLLYIIFFYNFSVARLLAYSKFNLEGENYLYKLYKVLNLPFGDILNFAVNTNEKPFFLFFHKGYFSMFLLFAITILFKYGYVNFKDKRYKRLAIKAGVIFIFLFVLFHWFSIPNIIALAFIIVFIVLFKLKNSKSILLGVGVLLLLSTPFSKKIIENNYTLKENIRQVRAFVSSPFSEVVERDAIRVSVYRCSYLLIKEAVVFGYGVGGVKDKLLNCYIDNEFRAASSYKLNSHNYFLHLWLSSGALTLFAFLFFIFKNLIQSVKRKQLLYFLFIIILLFNLLTENTLFRSHGVVFFSIFNSFLYLLSNKNNHKLEAQ